MESFEIQDGKVCLNRMEIPVIWKGEVLVVGGGTSGVTAAAAAARKKIPVLVVEKESYFGGAMSFGGGLPAEGAFPGDRSIGGMMDELLAQLRFAGKDSAVLTYEEERGTCYYYDSQYYKKLCDEILWKSGCQTMLNTTVTDVLASDGRVCGVIVSSNMKKGAVLAKSFVDCTGNAVLAQALHVPIQEESREKLFRYPYILYPVDCSRLEEYREKDPAFQNAMVTAAADGVKWDAKDRPWNLRTGVQKDTVYADTIFLSETEPDPMQTGTKVEQAARKKLYEHVDFFRKYIPGMENSRLIRCADRVLAEGGQRIRGLSCYTDELCREAGETKDGIVRFRSGREENPWYELPYHVMAPPMYENLLIAGKGISADSKILENLGAAGRMVMGQCAGIAASMIALQNKKNTELNGAYLRSVMEEVGCDLDGQKTRAFRPDQKINKPEGGI